MIQLKRFRYSDEYNDTIEPGQLVLAYSSSATIAPRVKVGTLEGYSTYQMLPYLVPDPNKYRDEGIYFPAGLNISCQQLDMTVDTVASLNGSPIATASSILNTGLKLIGIGTIYKHGTPYYSDPPTGSYIQSDSIVTFNDAAFLYDEGQDKYSQKHSYTSFVGYDHLVWDSTKNLYKFDFGPLNYDVTLVKITVYLSGGLIPATNAEPAGIWYAPYCSSASALPNWVDVGETSGKTFLDADYISLSGSRSHYYGSTYSVVHKINSIQAMSGLYYPNIGFSTYSNSKFVPGMGGTFCKMVIEVYASQSELIQ